MGIITSSNPLINGDIVVNSNFGDVVLLNPVTSVQTIIANGGTRGDYTAADPNGSLFLTQSDAIMRLSCGKDCSIGGPPPSSTPEPGSLLLLGTGLLALAGFGRKKLLNQA